MFNRDKEKASFLPFQIFSSEDHSDSSQLSLHQNLVPFFNPELTFESQMFVNNLCSSIVSGKRKQTKRSLSAVSQHIKNFRIRNFSFRKP